MSEINISMEGGTTKRLLTAGKYCDRDIVVTVESSGGESDGDEGIIDALIGRSITEISSNLTAVGLYAFHSCTKLTTVDLPSCRTLSNNAFQSCTSLVNIHIPKLTGAGTDTFNGCRFASVDFPELKTVSGRTFAGNNQLTRADFPKLTNVGTQCFNNCSALVFARMAPTSINSTGFGSCASLKALILLGSKVCTLANANAFSGTPIASGTGYIYVPASLADSYKAATNWSTYADQIRAIEDYPEITGG